VSLGTWPGFPSQASAATLVRPAGCIKTASARSVTGKGAESAACVGLPGRTAAGAKKVGMMADVACFCGCFYSFDGAGGACPTCGEYASVAAGPTPESEHRRPAVNGVRQNGQTARTFPDWLEAGASALAGVAATAGAGDSDLAAG